LTPKFAAGGRPWAAIVLFVAAGAAVLGSFLLQGSIAELGIGFTTSTAPGALLTGLGMLGCAASMYSQPTTRVLAGWLGGALALVALPAANFGGFVVGTLLGMLGAAASLAWTDSPRSERPERPERSELPERHPKPERRDRHPQAARQEMCTGPRRADES